MEQYKKEYEIQMEQVRFTKEGKENMMKRIKEKGKESKKGVNMAKYAGVAACLCILSGTAYATGILQPVSEIFAPIFGGSVAQTEIIDQIGRPLNASDTDKGVTITAEAIIGDKNNVCVVFKVAQKDGSPLELPDELVNEPAWHLDFWNAGIRIPVFGGSIGTTYFENSDDGHYRLIQMQTYDVDIPQGETVTASFEDLYYFSENGEKETLVKGNWDMKFQLNYEDTSVYLDVNESFVRDGVNFTIDSIQVSPIGYLVNYTIDTVVKPVEFGGTSTSSQAEHQLYWAGIELLFTLKDGTVLDCSNQSGGMAPKEDYILAHKSDIFDEIIPLEDIFSVTVGDVVVILE
ncbi:MAG: DUF4179 domain-containing protein [Eubacteriales bacterium]